MRLTGGEGRGRRLRGPGREGVRPTTDRVREALFDVLGARVRDAAFLDAYAGTGAVGIEALSRGASRVVFLERNPRLLRLIGLNLEVGAWAGTCEIIPGDVVGSLERLAERPGRMDIVFLDPPYEEPPGPDLLAAAARLLRPSGLLVVEHRSSRPAGIPDDGCLRPVRTYRHGDTSLTTFAPGAGGTAR